MSSLRRFTQSLVPFLLLGSCAELIGLSDYDTGQASDEGGGGEGDQGGSGGTAQGGTGGVAAKPGVGGEEDGGNANGGSLGGRPPRTGGTSGDGGMGGEPEGGDGGKGGTSATGGTTGGGTGGMSGTSGSGGAGNGGGGGTGGSPVCTEITLPTYVGAIIDSSLVPAVAAFVFEVEPELGTAFEDSFEIQFWDSGGSGSYDGALTGTFMLGPPGDDANYAFCSRCLIVYEDQDSSREKIYFQTEGSITLTDSSQQMDGFPSWTFDDVTLREVVIDADQISTVVPGGDCVHIDTMSYTREAPTNWVCNIAWYSDGDCDCGCGQFDPTCTGSSDTACDYCWCNMASSCTPSEVVATSNWLCN